HLQRITHLIDMSYVFSGNPSSSESVTLSLHDALPISYILEYNIGNINKEMVDIDPLNEDDFIIIKKSLKSHQAFTGSGLAEQMLDRKSTRLNSSHVKSSYADFCLKEQNSVQRKRDD